MSSPDDSLIPLGSRLLTFQDPEFYELELKVFERLKTSGNDRCVTAACKDLCVDPYDFKDRWGPLLRNHKPSEVLQNILNIKPKLGNPVHDIAKALNLNFATVRTIVKKLSMGPSSKHKRTKENLAHRMISSGGVSLKEAKATLGPKRKSRQKREDVPNEDDSLYSSDETESDTSEESQPKKKDPPKRERSASVVEKPPQKRPAPITGKTQSWYEQTSKLIANLEPYSTDIKPQPIAPDTQLRILGEFARKTTLAKACANNSTDEATFRRLWQSLMKLVPAYYLDAAVFVIVSLTKLGYGSCKIADSLGLTTNFVNQVLANLNLELGPTDCRAFDVTMLLINRETLAAAQISELCKSQADMGKRVVRRSVCRSQFFEKLIEEAGEQDAAERIMWLYERGFSLEVICTVLRVPRGMVKVLPTEED